MRDKDALLLEEAYSKIINEDYEAYTSISKKKLLNENFPQKEWDACFNSYKALPEKEQFIIKELTIDQLSEERPDEGVGSSDIWHTIFSHWEYCKRSQPELSDDDIWSRYLDGFDNKSQMRAGIRFNASKF
jgi:hypothetical protein